jgi:hypothetical protein
MNTGLTSVGLHFVVILVLAGFALNYSIRVFGQTEENLVEFVPGYKIVQGEYVNKELGYSFSLPAGMKGYLTDSKSILYSGNDIRFLGIQIHPNSIQSHRTAAPQ